MTKKKNKDQLEQNERIAVLRVERMALADLRYHPRNPRKHPDPGSPEWEALRVSLAHDYFDPMVVNMRPGPNYQVFVSGHLRHKVLVADGYTHADVSVVDYDEATHLARLLAANQQQGEDQADAVQALVVDLAAMDIDLQLTGIDQPALDALLMPLSDGKDAAPPGEDESSQVSNGWAVIIDCAGEQEQVALLNRFIEEGLACRALIL